MLFQLVANSQRSTTHVLTSRRDISILVMPPIDRFFWPSVVDQLTMVSSSSSLNSLAILRPPPPKSPNESYAEGLGAGLNIRIQKVARINSQMTPENRIGTARSARFQIFHTSVTTGCFRQALADHSYFVDTPFRPIVVSGATRPGSSLASRICRISFSRMAKKQTSGQRMMDPSKGWHGSVALWLLLLTMLHPAALAQTSSSVICPVADTFDTSVEIDTYDPVIRYSEISGLALSPTQLSPLGNPILFGMSDIGGGDRLGIWDSGTGQRLLSLQVPATNNGTCVLLMN